MEAVEYEKMFAVEDQHFWFRGKRRFIEALITRHLGGGPIDGEILDIGCGTGVNLTLLSRFGVARGIDMNRDALAFCAERGLGPVVREGSANELPFADASFGLVTLLDVLYHREVDPHRCLGEVGRVLRPGGHLLITDSALPILAGPHDQAVWGRERYVESTLRALVEGAGFSVRRLSYTNFFLFPAVLAVRMLEKVRGGAGSSVSTSLPRLNGAFSWLLGLEAQLLGRGIDFPVGSSIVCLAQKPQGS